MTELSSRQSAALRTLGPLEGARVAGGCDQCDAYQTVHIVVAGVWKVNVHHDPWCPELERRRST